VGANYFISDGSSVSSYVPGTAITAPGTYRVWAETWGAFADDGITPQQRITVGSDFTIVAVPEPSTCLALLSGVVALAGIRRRNKS